MSDSGLAFVEPASRCHFVFHAAPSSLPQRRHILPQAMSFMVSAVADCPPRSTQHLRNIHFVLGCCGNISAHFHLPQHLSPCYTWPLRRCGFFVGGVENFFQKHRQSVDALFLPSCLIKSYSKQCYTVKYDLFI